MDSSSQATENHRFPWPGAFNYMFYNQGILIRTDDEGNLIDQRFYPDEAESASIAFLDMAKGNDSLFVACGHYGHRSFIDPGPYEEAKVDSFSYFAMAFDQDLDTLWTLIHDTLNRAYWNRVNQAPGANFILCGQHIRDVSAGSNGDTLPIGEHHQYGVLSLITSEGKVRWHKRYAISPREIRNSNVINNVRPAPDGGYVAVGYAHTPVDIGRNQNMWFIKTDSIGCVYDDCNEIITRTKEMSGDGFPSADLIAYPNPTTDRVSINLPAEKLYGHKIIKSNGVVIDDLQFTHPDIVDKYVIDMSYYPSGIYIVALRLESGWTTVKVVKQ